MESSEMEFGRSGEADPSAAGDEARPDEGSSPQPGSFATPPSSAPQAGTAGGSSPRPARTAARSNVVLAALVAMLVVATSALGALISHEFWAGTTSPSAASQSLGGAGGVGDPFAGQLPSAGLGNGFGGSSSAAGSSGSEAAASGSPSDIASVAAKVDPGLVDINTSLSYQSAEAAGTGLVISSNGEILTNNHVIDGATTITATDIGNGRTYTATVVGYDPSHDIAVLQLKGASGLKTVTLGNSARAAVGQAVVGIGNAGGAGGTPSSVGGSIGALDQSITAGDELGGMSEKLSGLIETNADIQPGDSGGSLVNSSGQVIGIDTAGSEGFSFQPLQGSTTQAYAIPINAAVAIARQIEAGHGSTTTHIGETAFLGVGVAPALSTTGGGGFGRGFGGFGGFQGGGAAPSTGSSAAGVTISNVIAGDPAAKAGLSEGDLITSLGGHAVQSASQLSALLLGHHPGDSVTVGWTDSAGQAHTTSVTLASGPPA